MPRSEAWNSNAPGSRSSMARRPWSSWFPSRAYAAWMRSPFGPTTGTSSEPKSPTSRRCGRWRARSGPHASRSKGSRRRSVFQPARLENRLQTEVSGAHSWRCRPRGKEGRGSPSASLRVLGHPENFGFAELLVVGVFPVPLDQRDEFLLILGHHFEAVFARDLHPTASHVCLHLPQRGRRSIAMGGVNGCSRQLQQQLRGSTLVRSIW